jgi:hypothetical protein
MNGTVKHCITNLLNSVCELEQTELLKLNCSYKGILTSREVTIGLIRETKNWF